MDICSYCGFEIDITKQVCTRCHNPINLTYPDVETAHSTITNNFRSRVFFNIFSKQIRQEIKQNTSLNYESIHVAWFAFLVYAFISALGIIARLADARTGYYYMQGTLRYVNRNIIFQGILPLLWIMIFLYLTPVGMLFSGKKQPFSDIFRCISYPASLTVLVFCVVITSFYPNFPVMNLIGSFIVFGFALTLIPSYIDIFDIGIIKAIILYSVIFAVSLTLLFILQLSLRDYLAIPL